MTLRTASRLVSLLGVAGGLLAVTITPAAATNGYFAHAHGAPAKGMAGAGTAHNRGPLAAATNPALGVRTGNIAGACVTHFRPDRDVEINGSGFFPNGSYKSKNDAFNILCGGANFQNEDGESAWGVLVTANGGMNTEYDAIFNQQGINSGVDLAQMFFGLNYARKIDNNMTLGIMPMLAVQRFRATGLGNFDNRIWSTSPGNVTDRNYDHSFGGGLKVGALYDVSALLSVGASYQSQLMMQDFDRYAGLLAEGGNFDIPAIARAGVAIRPVDDWTFMVDYEKIFYGSVDSISNSGLNCQLGGTNGCGFGWTDMKIWRVAAEWNTTQKLTLRTGYSWSNDFADSNEVLFNTLAPATITQHASAGFSYGLSDSWGLTGAYTRAFSDSKSGLLPLGGGTAKLRMDQHELSFGVSYRW